MIKLLTWDSEFYGFPTGQILMEDALKAGANGLLTELQNQNIRFLYLFHDLSIKSDTNEKLKMLQTIGAHLVDTKIVYGKDLSLISKTRLPENISEYTLPQATDRLYQIALESGVYSRFRLDPNIPTGSYERMYRLWLDNSINRKIADHVIVSKDEAQIVNGMVTLSLKDESAVIGLIAVHPDGLGKGIGSQLMQAAEHFAVGAGKTHLTVATQKANKAACRFYQKAGYTEDSRVEVWHWWSLGNRK